ncbi:15046_t:CDS:2, partial [Cetraspora pellucida]
MNVIYALCRRYDGNETEEDCITPAVGFIQEAKKYQELGLSSMKIDW